MKRLADISELENKKGVYILLCRLDKNIKIKTGALGWLHFEKGFYLYTGSAMNGLKPRLERHLRKEKKFHWHIDYFLNKGHIEEIFYSKAETKEKECVNAGKLERKGGLPVMGFGCSDCNCKSHLFYFIEKPEIR
jgi:Uri superfamily endonuclease